MQRAISPDNTHCGQTVCRDRLFLILSLLSAGLVMSDPVVTADDRFETHIRPVLVNRCFKCHGGDNVSGELRVDSREALIKGGEGGPVIVPGKPEESRLLTAIGYADETFQMPPEDPLPPAVVAEFRSWIEQGAVWPESVRPEDFQTRRHWAFEPVQRPELPQLESPDIQSPVDLFLLQKLEEKGLSFSPPADRPTLLRRLSIDLLGLPPTAEDLQKFVADQREDAVDRAIEQMLASPRYGERWARHWLDIARYADTKGYVFQEDRKYPFAYTYRDWVVRALNEDKPYDQFLIEQMAADLVPEHDSESLKALGFLTLGRRFLNNRHDIINDRIDVVTRSTMGLTVACARCHDHKYDPIPTADYYSLYGVFASSSMPKELPGAMVLEEAAQPFNPKIFLRGSPGQPGDSVPRQFLQVVAGPDRKPFENGSGRLEMAQQIASRDNPLTARVMVNRLWLLHFHRPLVQTPSDFGLRSDPPSHPELLDFLAAELVDNNWSLKHIHRLILKSRAWQQSSQVNARGQALDPENSLLWRMNRYRLDFEAMRDSLLAASAELNDQMFGEPVEIAEAAFESRRSLYGHIDRQNLPALFRTFDFASPDNHSPGRFETSVPQQTLYLRNSPFMAELVSRLIANLRWNDSTAEAERITGLYRRIYGRNPAGDELSLCAAFIREASSSGGPDERSPAVVYGFGRINRDRGVVEEFQPLPHWTGSAWQGGPKLPDSRIGWVTVRSGGGHPGNTEHSLIIRWTAPIQGNLQLRGRLENPSEQGDGVQALVVSGRQGRLGQWSINHGEVRTGFRDIPVEAGEVIDLIVDCNTNESHDSFSWNPSLRIENAAGEIAQWSLDQNFSGPAPRPMSRWEQLAQVLLLSNEFMFVD